MTFHCSRIISSLLSLSSRDTKIVSSLWSQRLTTMIGKGYTSTEESFQQEATKNEKHMQQGQLSSQKFDRTAHEKILQSLFYPEITRRQEQISDPYEDTYQWIFRSKDDQQKPWNSFCDWLSSSQTTYWIHGKPGSGKSTLMRFIHTHEQTSRLLQSWCSSRLILTPAFFFWSAGSVMQKSIVGLLRSLLYQLLSDCPELMILLKVIASNRSSKLTDFA